MWEANGLSILLAAHTSTAQSSNLHGSRICGKLYNDGNVTEHKLSERDEGSTSITQNQLIAHEILIHVSDQ